MSSLFEECAEILVRIFGGRISVGSEPSMLCGVVASCSECALVLFVPDKEMCNTSMDTLGFDFINCSSVLGNVSLENLFPLTFNCFNRLQHPVILGKSVN